ncbi:hypothetical protein SmJEL517_g05437 [Synchytrium microbalum]|uniref:Mitochondrial mRNA-processing protein COX24 C-terminal domain-containing protein n=1 Tax=Synchytrium microbalum TaxID=1806994 RepID=A0A507C103_9FUNG|nr:uncharacterized protein SmJEL517_g05437 [Synchytrium microbalum]TPX31183.1 hypothetical protein SmJEL517_g05437 [Synchytrium microbalum]
MNIQRAIHRSRIVSCTASSTNRFFSSLYQATPNRQRHRRNKAAQDVDSFIEDELLPAPIELSLASLFLQHRPLAVSSSVNTGSSSSTQSSIKGLCIERQLREDASISSRTDASSQSPRSPTADDGRAKAPFEGFQALTGGQYFKPSRIALSSPTSTSPSRNRTSYRPSAGGPTMQLLSPNSPSDHLSPDQLVDILLSGTPSSGWDTVTRHLVQEHVMTARIQAQVSSMAREALRKIESRRNTGRRVPGTSTTSRTGMYAISLIKRRRKKMNKHKLEKRIEKLRGTQRANKEMLRKRGQNREKKE